jgi:hypothetical protein
VFLSPPKRAMSPPTESPGATRGPSAKPDAASSEHPGQAFGDALRQVGVLRAYLGYYLSTRLDQIKLTVRWFIICAVLAVIGLVGVGAVVVTAVVQVLGGVASAIGQAAPSHPWIGSLITGLVVLAAVAIALRWGVGFMRRASQAAIVAKYEAFKRQQREQFGRSVDDGAN